MQKGHGVLTFRYKSAFLKLHVVLSAPKLFKPGRIGGRIYDGVLNVPVPKIVLNQARVGPLIGQGKAASMARSICG